MSTIATILVCLLLVAALAIMFLWFANKDLNRDLDFVANERDKWEKRAREAGWRYPLEQAAFDLQQSTDAIGAAARALANSTETAKRNTEALKNLAQQAKGALELTRTANDSLDKAARHLGRLNTKSGPLPATLPAPHSDSVLPESLSRLVLDAVGRIEKSGGQIEPDPKKRN